jgi:methylated-DNA-[protein]-cysteine S-methyltransferase
MGSEGFETVHMEVADQTPLGPVWVAVSAAGLVAVRIAGSRREFIEALAPRFAPHPTGEAGRTRPVVQQITEYLGGVRKHFDLTIDWSQLSAFQTKALRAVCAVPYGQTCTYGQIASQIGMPGAARAVGRANATNPVPLVIPCHRLVGADGSLRGYGSGQGITTKAWLLELERTNS